MRSKLGSQEVAPGRVGAPERAVFGNSDQIGHEDCMSEAEVLPKWDLKMVASMKHVLAPEPQSKKVKELSGDAFGPLLPGDGSQRTKGP